MRFGPLKYILAGLCLWPFASGAAGFDSKTLVEIAHRHQLPLPPKAARLVLAHTGWWSVLGNQSTSKDPGIYSPAFLLAEQDGGPVVVLRGASRETLENHRQDPSWLPFSTKKIEPKLGGHVVSFNRLSAFVCAVQLASIGEEKLAESVWESFSTAQIWSDGRPFDQIREQIKNPSLLLGRCLFDYRRNQLLQAGADWKDIHAKIGALFSEFPALKQERYRQEVYEGLTAALKAATPRGGSVEELLVLWSKEPVQLNGFGLFKHDETKEPGTPLSKIILRGAEAVPELISLLEDKRITAHEVPRINNSPARLQSVGELALQLLKTITGISGGSPWSEPAKEQFTVWFDKQRQTGEMAALVQAAFVRSEDKITGVNETPMFVLAQKYPEKLLSLTSEFSAQAKDDAQPFSLAEAIATSSLPLETRVRALADFARLGSLEHKRCVLQNLAKIDAKRCAEILIPLLETLPMDSQGEYWTCPEAAFSHVVMEMEDDATWKKYLQVAKRSSIGLRMEMMNPLNYAYIGNKNRNRRLAFLATFLDDKNLRVIGKEEGKFGGPCAAFTIPKITVGDFAAGQLASMLGLADRPDEFWTPAQWEKLQRDVRRKLSEEALPDYTSP